MSCRIAGTLLIVIVMSCRAALAQEAGGTAVPPIPARATIFVLDTQNVEHSGRFVRFDDQELVMLVGDDERRFRRDVITRIERRGDSLKNGAIAGAILGGAMGVLTAFTQADNAPVGIAMIALNTALYTAIGTGFDAGVQGRTVVYHAWPTPTALVRQPRRAALAFSVRW